MPAREAGVGGRRPRESRLTLKPVAGFGARGPRQDAGATGAGRGRGGGSGEGPRGSHLGRFVCGGRGPAGRRRGMEGGGRPRPAFRPRHARPCPAWPAPPSPRAAALTWLARAGLAGAGDDAGTPARRAESWARREGGGPGAERPGRRARGKSLPGPPCVRLGGGGAGGPATSRHPRPGPVRATSRAPVAAARRPRPARKGAGRLGLTSRGPHREEPGRVGGGSSPGRGSGSVAGAGVALTPCFLLFHPPPPSRGLRGPPWSNVTPVCWDAGGPLYTQGGTLEGKGLLEGLGGIGDFCLALGTVPLDDPKFTNGAFS